MEQYAHGVGFADDGPITVRIVRQHERLFGQVNAFL